MAMQYFTRHVEGDAESRRRAEEMARATREAANGFDDAFDQDDEERTRKTRQAVARLRERSNNMQGANRHKPTRPPSYERVQAMRLLKQWRSRSRTLEGARIKVVPGMYDARIEVTFSGGEKGFHDCDSHEEARKIADTMKAIVGALWFEAASGKRF